MDSNSIANYEWIDAIDGLAEIPSASLEIGDPYTDPCVVEHSDSRKRTRDDSSKASTSKACREKMRRERLNDRFAELGSILEPERPHKTDKAMILSDATRLLIQLRSEAQELKDANEKLQETIKDLKVEKNQLREEKTKLKAEKERLELQIKALPMPCAPYLPQLPPFHPAAFAAQGQAPVNKTAVFPGYPGVAMWQWVPAADVDTSQDHTFQSPAA